MARKIREVGINLQEQVLEGWENPCNLLNVLILNEARNLGHVLLRVDVVREGEVYRIVFGRREDWYKQIGINIKWVMEGIQGQLWLLEEERFWNVIFMVDT